MKPEGLKFGDMKFIPKEQDTLKRGEDMEMTHGHGYAAVNDNNLRWKDAVIRYVIDCSIGEFENFLNRKSNSKQAHIFQCSLTWSSEIFKIRLL